MPSSYIFIASVVHRMSSIVTHKDIPDVKERYNNVSKTVADDLAGSYKLLNNILQNNLLLSNNCKCQTIHLHAYVSNILSKYSFIFILILFPGHVKCLTVMVSSIDFRGKGL